MDGDISLTDKKETTAKSAGHSHETSEDLCSPFCVCSCCGVQILNFAQPVAFAFRIALPSIQTPIPSYKSTFISGYFGSVWQPPQIV